MHISGMQRMPVWHATAKRVPSDANLSRTIGVASEQTYTKEDAVWYQYNRQFDFNVSISDIISGKQDMTGFRLPSFEPEDLEAYRQQIEEDGLGDEIRWNGVSYDFSTVGVELDTAQMVKSKADYIASRYAVLKDRIQTQYTEDGQKAQMEKLDTLFVEAKEKLASSYAAVVGGFFNQNGVTGAEERLKESVMQGIDSRVDAYTAYLKSNPNYVAIASEKDAWLLQDDGYMAARLRENMAGEVVADTKALYSLQDLELAGMYVQQTAKQYASLEHTGFIRNEESIGLDLAVQAIKTEYLVKHSGMGKEMGALLQRVMEGYKENVLDKLDEQLKEDKTLFGSKKLYAPLERSAVDAVYRYTMQKYHTLGNMKKALAEGAQYAKERYDQKVDSSAYGTAQRYQSSLPAADTWEGFFHSTQNSPYSLSISDFEKYNLTLDHFAKSVQNGMDIELLLGMNGDISANRVTYETIGDYMQEDRLDRYA